MDRTSQQVISGFYTAPNVNLLKSLVAQEFGRDSPYLGLLPQLMENFRTRMFKELMGNDIVVESASGDIVLEQIYLYDEKFMESLRNNLPSKIRAYSVGDGIPVATGKRGEQLIQSMAPDDMLKAWRDRPSRSITLRDDTQNGKSVFGSRYQDNSPPFDLSGEPFNRNGIAGRGGYVLGGIEFADQSGSGLNEYYDYYINRPAMKKWNDQTRPYYRDAPIGHVAADEDRKAFTQRYMRSYDGCDGAIPSYRRWPHNRNVDRDNSETFAGPQHEFIQRGFDRTPLFERIAAIRTTQRMAEGNTFPLRSLVNHPRDVD